MQGYFCLVLHGHLPFVRHPEHPTFLEENWLFEAITECYIPLLQVMEGWGRDQVPARLAMTLSPTLCSMLRDPLLQERYSRYINNLVDLAEKETYRTYWDKGLRPLAEWYLERFKKIRETYQAHDRDLVSAFRDFQDLDILEIITTAATHAVLPLLQDHPASVRAQLLAARDHYQSCFGINPRGIWLPECAYADGLEAYLHEAKIRWFTLDTHGVLYAHPQPQYSVFAPVLLPNGVAAFGRDFDSAKQVWSRDEGYPGDVRYRDFYRDVGFDLDLDYLKPYLPAPPHRSFTGIKYHAITGKVDEKKVYNRALALQVAAEHARHFLEHRVQQIRRLSEIMERPPVLMAPYDAELFGHWWYEGPEFLDYFFRKACFDQNTLIPINPSEYLRLYPTHQVATPSSSSWGEDGYLKVWLNETNQWIYPHLRVAQERMTELARRFPEATGINARALNQAGRELLLAQSSDWPFIMRTGTSPEYATQRVKDHLLRFLNLHDQLISGKIDETWLREIETTDNIFPELNYLYWA